MASMNALIYKNHIKDVCSNKSINVLKHLYQSFNTVSNKNSMDNTAFYWWSKNKRKIRDNKEVFALFFSELSKVFSSIQYALLIAKLNPFGFVKKLLSFTSAYLDKEKQKTNTHFICYICSIFILLTITDILLVMQMIPLCTFVDEIFLKS